MWEQEAREYLMSFITDGSIFSGDLTGINDNGVTATATAIVVKLDTNTGKAVEKYFFIVKKDSVKTFYEMDKLPTRF